MALGLETRLKSNSVRISHRKAATMHRFKSAWTRSSPQRAQQSSPRLRSDVPAAPTASLRHRPPRVRQLHGRAASDRLLPEYPSPSGKCPSDDIRFVTLGLHRRADRHPTRPRHQAISLPCSLPRAEVWPLSFYSVERLPTTLPRLCLRDHSGGQNRSAAVTVDRYLARSDVLWTQEPQRPGQYRKHALVGVREILCASRTEGT